MQAVNIAVLPLICTLMQTGLQHQNDYENKQVMEAWWRGWRWSSLLFLEQLAECFGAGKQTELGAVSQEPQVRLWLGQWLNLATPLQRPMRGRRSGEKSLLTWMFSLKELVDWIFLFQLVALQFNAKEFLNDWVENLAPNPTETLVPSHSYLSTLFTNHHHNPSQRKNPHWMWCDSFHTFTQQMCTKKPFRWNSSRWASW